MPFRLDSCEDCDATHNNPLRIEGDLVLESLPHLIERSARHIRHHAKFECSDVVAILLRENVNT